MEGRRTPAKEWLTSEETQAYLGVKRTTLYRERGRLRPVKRGNRLYYSKARLLAYLESVGD